MLLKMGKDQIDANSIIGRVKEKQELEIILNSPDPELHIIYGRRRIGKTFLIHNYCGKRGVYFYFRAEENITGSKFNINNFLDEIIEVMNTYDLGVEKPLVTHWTDAFNFFYEQMLRFGKDKKIIILFDELPWFCTKKSNFLPSFSHFFNKKVNNVNNNHIKIFCTGSATSFLIHKVVNNPNGLFARMTSYKLKSFSLSETTQFLNKRGINISLSGSKKRNSLDQKDVLTLYLVFGGVAHYLKQVLPGRGIDETINRSFFGNNPTFNTEFSELFKGTFGNSEIHKSVVEFIGVSKGGKNSSEIYKFIKNKFANKYNGEQIAKATADLVHSDLLSESKHYSLEERVSGIADAKYLVCDEYLLFYLTWINGNVFKKNEGYWNTQKNNRKTSTWSSDVFERVCRKHIKEIFKKIGIHANVEESFWWKDLSNKKSKEIDILVHRDDKHTTIIEVKFYEKEYSLNKSRAKEITDKIDSYNDYRDHIKETSYNKLRKNKELNVVFLTAVGISHNKFYLEIPISNNFRLIDLI